MGERLVLLSLALEAAIQGENWAEAACLFANRESLIAEVERSGAISPDALSRAQAVEARLLALLKDRRQSVVEGMRERSKERTATAAYRTGATLASLDRTG